MYHLLAPIYKCCAPWGVDHISFAPHKAHLTGMAYYFFNIPMIELVPWGMTLGCWFTSVIINSQTILHSTGGEVKPSSVHPRFWLYLALGTQYTGFLVPQLMYWTTTAGNGFHQPEWWRKYALPSPPDVFGFDGELVGRAVGSLGVAVGWAIFCTVIIALGDQYATFGVSTLFSRGLPDTDRRLAPPGLQVREKPRLSVHGPYEYVRHPLYAQVYRSLFAEPYLF